MRSRTTLLWAVVPFVSLVACGEPASPNTPASTGATSAPSSAPPPETAAPTTTAAAPPTATASAPVAGATTPPPSTSGTPAPTGSAPALTAGKCKTNADCPSGYHCALGMPLNGVCWQNGKPAPICLAGDTMIDTPSGARPVHELAAGDLVWSVDAAGKKVAAPLLQASHIEVPRSHEMARVTMTDGREVFVSPGHPTCPAARGDAKEATLADLSGGAHYDGGTIRRATREPYGADATYDVLPAGETGCYFANGVLLGSTLFVAPGR